MTYTPVVVEQFGGLNLVNDPEEVGAQGAIDMLNVDLTRRGRAGSRDGFTSLATSGFVLNGIAPYYKTDGTKQLLVGASDRYLVYNTSGSTVGSALILGNNADEVDFTRFGGPSAEVAYASAWLTGPPTNTHPVYKWNGSTWTLASGIRLGGAGNYPFALEVQATDNRLVGAFPDDNASRVGFSNAGVPETWDTNDYVILTPGDGERITALVAWRELVFAFKETKFFVFTGNSLGAGGTAIFNDRAVASGIGTIARNAATATPGGVYFLSRRGVYRTTGGDPVLVSRDIDPVFRGGSGPTFLGGELNHAAIDQCRLAWHDERLFFAYPSGSSTSNDRLLVFDPETGAWLLWDLPVIAMTSFRTGDAPELVFTGLQSSFHHVFRFGSAYTTDNGVAITSRIQSGFYELGTPGAVAYTRWTRAWGSGSPTLSVLTDYGTSDTAAGTLTLGTSPTVAEGYHQQAYQGKLFSHKLSATSAWSVSRLQHDVAAVKS